jgi:hypothetical protein
VSPQGKHVALVYTAPPGALVVDAIKTLQEDGATVSLIGPRIGGYERAAELAGEGMIPIRYRHAPVPVDRDNPPARWSREWQWVVARNLWRKGTAKVARKLFSASVLWWRTISHDKLAVRRLEEADVLTAVDGGAIYPVWKAAQRNLDAVAINGVGPTLQHFGLAD